jgi:hypothetical protein
MDFADSPEHAAFRAELRYWLDAKLPKEITVDDSADQCVHRISGVNCKDPQSRATRLSSSAAIGTACHS